MSPQFHSKDGKTLTPQAVERLTGFLQASGMTLDQFVTADQQGSAGRASERLKLLAASDAWGRDRDALRDLNAKRNLHGELSLNETVKRATLMKRLGKS